MALEILALTLTRLFTDPVGINRSGNIRRPPPALLFGLRAATVSGTNSVDTTVSGKLNVFGEPVNRKFGLPPVWSIPVQLI